MNARPAPISLEEIRRRARDPALVLVDVLSPASWEEGHLPGAISLPLADVRAHAAQTLPAKDADIVVYCGGPT